MLFEAGSRLDTHKLGSILLLLKFLEYSRVVLVVLYFALFFAFVFAFLEGLVPINFTFLNRSSQGAVAAFRSSFAMFITRWSSRSIIKALEHC